MANTWSDPDWRNAVAQPGYLQLLGPDPKAGDGNRQEEPIADLVLSMLSDLMEEVRSLRARLDELFPKAEP